MRDLLAVQRSFYVLSDRLQQCLVDGCLYARHRNFRNVFTACHADHAAVNRKKEELLDANGVNMNIFTASRIVGTALGGVMLVGMSLFSLYTVTLVSYVILLISTFF